MSIKEKYIEEKFNRHMIFGRSASGDGLVCVCNASADTIATVNIQEAEAMVSDRHEIVDMLIKVSQKLDELDHEAFSEIWYEE